MDEENCRKRLRDEASCPVCLDYYTDPVTLECGHNFCTSCVASCWSLSPGNSTCPLCRGLVETKKLRPNSQLANMVEVAQDLSNLLKHRRVFSKEEAEKEVAKDRISRYLKILRKDRENISRYIDENEKESRDLLAQIEAESMNTTAVFRKYHQFLEEQEALLRSQMEEAKVEVSRKRDENLARLTGELTSLDGHIQELEEKKQQSVIELQNLGDIFERFKRESLENPVTFPAALRWKIHEFQDINPYLDGVIQKVKDILLSGFQIEEVNVNLDEDTAFPGHILSRDLKSVRWENEIQDLIDRPDENQDFIVRQDENQELVDRPGEIQDLVDRPGEIQDLIDRPGEIQDLVDRPGEIQDLIDRPGEIQDLVDRPGEIQDLVYRLGESQDVPDNAEIFNDWPFLLAYEEFETGRVFWDVEVGPEGEWAVGVAEEFASCQNFSEISPENGVWDLGKWNGAYRVHDPLHTLPLSVSQEVKKIRVTLNFEGGRVAFYDADTGRQLYVYKDTFPPAIHPYFSVSGRGRLTILS